MTDDELKKDAALVEVIVACCNHYWAPLQSGGAFDFSDPQYLRNGFDIMARIARFRRPRQKPVNLFMHRGAFELAGLFYLLRAQVNCGDIWEQEMSATGWT